MICKKCGAMIPDDSMFCEICGEKVAPASETVDATPRSCEANETPNEAVDEKPIISSEKFETNLKLIKQLKELLDLGAISQEEYEEKKRELLNYNLEGSTKKLTSTGEKRHNVVANTNKKSPAVRRANENRSKISILDLILYSMFVGGGFGSIALSFYRFDGAVKYFTLIFSILLLLTGISCLHIASNNRPIVICACCLLTVSTLISQIYGWINEYGHALFFADSISVIFILASGAICIKNLFEIFNKGGII